MERDPPKHDMQGSTELVYSDMKPSSLLKLLAVLLALHGCTSSDSPDSPPISETITATPDTADTAPADIVTPDTAATGDNGRPLTDAVEYDVGHATDTSRPIPEDPDVIVADATPDDAPGHDADCAIDTTEPGDEDEWTGLFDMARISDPEAADCRFEARSTVLKNGVWLDLFEISYLSYESVMGVLVPIRIRGYAARPRDGSDLPGIVQSHGLGGMAEESHATGTASLLEMFVLAYTGPGGGDKPANTSEGLGAGHAGGYRLFDTLVDPRGSWFWAHAVAAMRGLTCLAAHPDVDPERLGMTGFSAGGVTTLISSAVDERIKAGVPVSGTGAWDEAVKSPLAWQHALLDQAGLTTASAEWTTLIEHLDSRSLLPATSTKLLMINGTGDEFFPLTAHMATFDAIPGDDKRTSLVANFDHGCYSVSGFEDTETIEKRANLRVTGGQLMWFRHWLSHDPDFTHLPHAPVVEWTPNGPLLTVVAQVDGGGSRIEVEEVRAWGSNDDAYLFIGDKLDHQGDGVYMKVVPFQMQANSVMFVDVQYKTKSLLAPKRFSISSPPVLPDGFQPRVRSIENCL